MITALIAGSFDLIHPGYIRMFKAAKEGCDHLIVALQGDPTLDRPEKCKPVQSLEDRIEILTAIKYIDEIKTYNTEAELLQLLKTTHHDLRVLGTDYVDKNYTGKELGVPVLWVQRDHDYSTTSLKEAVHRERAEFHGRKNLNRLESAWYPKKSE